MLGGEVQGREISAKYIGSRRTVQIAIATLATDRALMLMGEPGTAKSWLSEHLSAAISGTSQLLIQGTAGTSEEHVRYGWNYALLLAEGPSERALIPSPVMRAMREGRVVRVEELTRVPSEVQDALVTLLSEKSLAITELDTHIPAQRGFGLIATANVRDRGVNEMSAALRRRFNTVSLGLPVDLETEVAIVDKRVRELGAQLDLPTAPPARALVTRVVQIFQELRLGRTHDGKRKIQSPAAILSTAEAIDVLQSAMSLAGHFGSGNPGDSDVAEAIVSAVVRDDDRDRHTLTEYVDLVLAPRGAEWRAMTDSLRKALQ